jgi:hypothetical protein
VAIVHTKGKHYRESKMRREEGNSRKTRKYDFNRACPEVAEGNSRDTAGQESVRLRKKGKVGKKGRTSVMFVRSVEFGIHNPYLIFWSSDIPPTDILIL